MGGGGGEQPTLAVYVARCVSEDIRWRVEGGRCLLMQCTWGDMFLRRT